MFSFLTAAVFSCVCEELSAAMLSSDEEALLSLFPQAVSTLSDKTAAVRITVSLLVFIRIRLSKLFLFKNIIPCECSDFNSKY